MTDNVQDLVLFLRDAESFVAESVGICEVIGQLFFGLFLFGLNNYFIRQAEVGGGDCHYTYKIYILIYGICLGCLMIGY